MIKVQFSGQIIPCPLCSSDNHTVISELDRYGAPLRTVLCKQCGHVFTNPQPTSKELKTFYSGHYRNAYKGITTPKQKHIYRAGLRAVERLRYLQNFCTYGSKVLDVGSGGGEFVYLLQKAGYLSRGIEPNGEYADFSKAAYGIDVATCGLEDIVIEPHAWNAITLHHVLEHLADPVGALRLLATGLAKNGFLIIEVPNVEARYHAPQRLFHLAHLHTFSLDSLAHTAQKAGLEASSIQLQPHTENILVALKKNSNTKLSAMDQSVGDRIETALRTYTPVRDYLTFRPYRRLYANAKRPIKEYLALMRIGNPQAAKDILDRVFDKLEK